MAEGERCWTVSKKVFNRKKIQNEEKKIEKETINHVDFREQSRG